VSSLVNFNIIRGCVQFLYPFGSKKWTEGCCVWKWAKKISDGGWSTLWGIRTFWVHWMCISASVLMMS